MLQRFYQLSRIPGSLQEEAWAGIASVCLSCKALRSQPDSALCLSKALSPCARLDGHDVQVCRIINDERLRTEDQIEEVPQLRAYLILSAQADCKLRGDFLY